MTYETKSGRLYSVFTNDYQSYVMARKSAKATVIRPPYGIKELMPIFPSRADAEAALEAYANTHGWRRVK